MARSGGSVEHDVAVRICGRLSVRVGGQEADDARLGQLGRLALAFLVTERHRPVARDELADVIWGEHPPTTWPDALRGVVGRVRAVLEAAGLPRSTTLTSASGCYQLHLPDGAVVDVEQAVTELEAARAVSAADAVGHARRALSLTAGQFLAGSGGEWVERRQRALADLRLDALELLSASASAAGEPAVAVEAAEEAVALQPLRESAYLRLVEAHAASGNRAEALRAYERCRRVLAEELGVDPSETTQAAYLRLITEPPEIAPSPSGRLPSSTTSFVGRDRAIADVRTGLRTTRLLSLVGVGGVGKSRLALQVAGEVAGDYADGVWLVELAALADPDLVAPQVLAVVGGPEARVEPATESLTRQLALSDLLLVLDNCEHLVDACAELAAVLLARCPKLRILTTTREPLGVAGETVWPVPPLSAPEAVRLFVERAGAAAPDAVLDDGVLADVALVVHRLDGIPLAIELAAAWAKVLSVTEIARRLDDRFGMLVGGPRTAPARHQTLRAALDWSYESLSAAEAAVFRRLSVFAGGFTLAAAEAVCGAGDVLGTLSALFDKSLVLVDRSRQPTRYRQLETVRQYAAEQLVACGEQEATRHDHLAWAVGLAESAAADLEGAGQAPALDAFEADHDNLRAALDWAAGGGSGEAGGRLAAALWRFWEIRGWLAEGRAHLATWIGRDGLPPELRARLLNAAGILAQRHKDYAAARGWYEECLVVRRSIGEPLGVASALHGLANVAYLEGDLDAARSGFEENLALARQLGVTTMTAASLLNLGVIEHTLFMRNRISKDEAAARGLPLLLESMAEYERMGDRHGVALALENLGTLTAWLGDPVGAIRYQEQSLEIRRALGDKPGIAVSARFLSRLALRTGDCGTARGLTEECLAIERELGKAADEAEALAFMAEVSVAEENYDEARSLLEESLRLFRHRDDAAVPPWLLGALGQVAVAQRDFSAARARFEEQIERSRRLDQPGVLAGSRARLSLVARAEGRTAEAAALAGDVLADPKSRESKWILSVLGETLAGVAEDPLTAVRLLAASAGLRRRLDPPSTRPHLVAEYHRTLDSGRAVLGDEAFGAAWAAGESLTHEELAVALDGVVQALSPPAPPRR